jgi:zinc protease
MLAAPTVYPLRRPRRWGFALACLLFLAGILPASAAPQAALQFAHEESDLAPDSAARFGKLPNGLRYVVRSNGEPRNRASLRLVVLAGSFMEMEYQRGLAHFLEHLAFNGSRHYPKGTLVATLQRLGMSFGADTNAYT